MKIMIDSEYLDKLQKGMAVSEDGSVEVGKNLEVDGAITINTGDAGLYLITGDYKLNIYFEGNVLYFSGFKGEEAIFDFNLSSNSIYDQQNGITYLNSTNTKTLFGNKSIVGEGNIDLYRHTITLSTSAGGIDGICYLDWISSNNLKCGSIQDLRTLLGSGVHSLQASNPTGLLFAVVITPSTAEIRPVTSEVLVNIASVSDTVTTI